MVLTYGAVREQLDVLKRQSVPPPAEKLEYTHPSQVTLAPPPDDTSMEGAPEGDVDSLDAPLDSIEMQDSEYMDMPQEEVRCTVFLALFSAQSEASCVGVGSGHVQL